MSQNDTKNRIDPGIADRRYWTMFCATVRSPMEFCGSFSCCLFLRIRPFDLGDAIDIRIVRTLTLAMVK